MRDSVPSPRYSPVCNVLRQWKTSLILTYRVYQLYDIRAVRPSVVQFGLAKDPLNAERANVGPTSNDSKVNNIALKRLLWFYALATDRLFQRSSWSSYE